MDMKFGVKQLSCFIVTSLCLISVSVTAQDKPASHEPTVNQSDTVTVNNISVVQSEKDTAKYSVTEAVKTRSRAAADHAKNTSRKKVSDKKDAVESNTSKMLEGEGITNENADEKLGSWLQNAKSTDGMTKKGDVAGGAGLSDNLAKADLDVKPTEVYSDKQLKYAYDSLLTKVDWNVVNAMLRDPSSVNEGSILEAVFVKFPGLQRISRTKQDAMLLQGMAGGVDPTRTLSSLAAVHLHDLRGIRVSDSVLSHLPPLRGGKMDAKYMQYSEKYLRKLDSLRKINLRGARLSLKEREIDSLSKESRIRRHLGFFQKIYFEGVIGLLNGGWNGNINIIQLSPSVGYHFYKNISVGLGPSVVLQTQQKKLSTVLGMRSFLKYEILRYNLYLQLEDNILFPHVDRSTIEERQVGSQHALFTGVGYLLPVSKRIALNASVLYRITGDSAIPGLTGGSPWIYRIGISSTKAQSGKK